MNCFAGPVEYLMMTVFGLSEETMIITPDNRTWRFLLKDVMRVGNFGSNERKRGKRTISQVHKQARLWRFLFNYLTEVLWTSLWKAWH